MGGEFLIHSFSGQGVTNVVPDYLVVEVALCPPKGATMQVQAAVFALRWNGKKTVAAAGLGEVKSSLGHPQWRSGPHPDASAGAGMGGGVIWRAPGQPQPIPGQAPPVGTPRPLPGSDEDPLGGGVPRTPRLTAQELLVETALPEGESRGPVSGYLYFPFRGKAAFLKSVELLFGDAVVKLR